MATPTRRDGQRYTFLPANPSKMYTFLRGSPSKTYTYAPALLEGQTHRRTRFGQVDVALRRGPGGRSDINLPRRDPVRCLRAANCHETPHLVLAVDRDTDPGLISTPCSPSSPQWDWRGFLSGTPLAPIHHVLIDHQNVRPASHGIWYPQAEARHLCLFDPLLLAMPLAARAMPSLQVAVDARGVACSSFRQLA